MSIAIAIAVIVPLVIVQVLLATSLGAKAYDGALYLWND